MKGFIPFALILGIYTYLAWRISVWLGYALDEMSFAAAIAVAILTGFTWFLVSDWLSKMTRPYSPQTVKLDTKETPIQIILAALLAIVRFFLFTVLAIVVIVLIVRLS